MLYNLGIDLGNSKSKSALEVVTNINEKEKIKIFSYDSIFANGYDEFSKVKKIKVEYNNSMFSLGIGSENINKMKYFSDIYKLMFLTSIAKTLPDEITDIGVNVVSSLPVDSFKDKQLKAEIKKNILNWGVQKIIVDDIEYRIEINNFDIWIEGGITLTEPDYYKNKKIIVHDIGGYTQDSIEFIYGELGRSKTKEKSGIINLREELYNLFKTDNNIDLDIKAQLELFDKIKENDKEKRNFQIGEEYINLNKYYIYIENFVADIFSSLEKTFNLSDKEVIFIGGGSIVLNNFLKFYKNAYKYRILKDAEIINALANLEYAKTLSIR